MTCPKCHYKRKWNESAPAWQCPNCGIAYQKYSRDAAPRDIEYTDHSDVSEVSEKRERAKSRLRNLLVPIMILWYIFEYSWQCGKGLWVLILAGYFAFAVHQMKVYGFYLGGEWTPDGTKEESPIMFRIEVIGGYALVPWFGFIGIYQLSQCL